LKIYVKFECLKKMFEIYLIKSLSNRNNHHSIPYILFDVHKILMTRTSQYCFHKVHKKKVEPFCSQLVLEDGENRQNNRHSNHSNWICNRSSSTDIRMWRRCQWGTEVLSRSHGGGKDNDEKEGQKLHWWCHCKTIYGNREN